MSSVQPTALQLPVPSADLHIQPFDAGLGGSGAERFLVIKGVRQHVVGSEVRILLEQLRRTPASWEELAERHAQTTGKHIDPADLQNWVTESMPADWFRDSSRQEVADPFICRFDLLRGPTLAPLTRRLSALFNRRLAMLLVPACLLVLGLTLPHATAQMQTGFPPAETAVLIGCLLIGVMWHEFGHLAAAARAGIQHGAMGVGLYWLVPAMYSDVTQAWQAPARARVLIDAGGLYFQSMFVTGVGICALLCDSAFAYKLVWMTTFTMLHTLNPFFKFDGYWLLSDAAGLTNLHAQVRQTLVGVLRRTFGRKPAQRPIQHRLQLAVLYAYTTLCGAYLIYVAQYLHGAISRVWITYPTEIKVVWGAFMKAVEGGQGWSLLECALRLITTSFWPACLMLGATLMVWIMLTRLAVLLVKVFEPLRAQGATA